MSAPLTLTPIADHFPAGEFVDGFEPAEPHPGVKPGGLAERALAALRRTRPPRNYAAENAFVLAARAARKAAREEDCE